MFLVIKGSWPGDPNWMTVVWKGEHRLGFLVVEIGEDIILGMVLHAICGRGKLIGCFTDYIALIKKFSGAIFQQSFGKPLNWVHHLLMHCVWSMFRCEENVNYYIL